MASHADVVSDKPGKCPKCEMDLVPTDTVAHGKIAEENWRKQRSASAPGMKDMDMPEHPDVHEPKPGKCPKCEMDLVPTDTVAHGKIAEANWRKQHPGGP